MTNVQYHFYFINFTKRVFLFFMLQNGKGPNPHLDKPQQMDEMLSSSSRETNGTDSGRGMSEDDSQAVESVRSENGQ